MEGEIKRASQKVNYLTKREPVGSSSKKKIERELEAAE